MRSEKKEALDIRNELEIDSEATVFLFAGKLEAKKQPIELAEAFASLQSQAHLIYVGSGMLEDALKERFDAIPTSISWGFKTNPKCPFGIELRMSFVCHHEGRGKPGDWPSMRLWPAVVVSLFPIGWGVRRIWWKDNRLVGSFQRRNQAFGPMRCVMDLVHNPMAKQ